MRIVIPLAAALLAAGLPPNAVSAQERPVDLLITGATVVDVRSGELLPERTIAIRHDTIVAVTASRGAPLPIARRVVDARGRFVIPGLSDMHVHFGGGPALVAENRNLLPLYVAHGVTAVRDAAADLSASVVAWRDSIAGGRLQGPTIFTSGPKLEGINSVWPGDLEVGSRAEVDAALDSLQALRADFVKLTDNTLDPSLFLYALGAIRQRGLRSSAHVPLPVAVRDAVEAGLGSIEHLSYAIKAGSPREAELSRARAAGRIPSRVPPEDAIARFDSATAMATYRLMARRGTAITPTLLIGRTLAYLDRDDHADDAYLQYIGPGLRATYRGRVERAARDDSAAVARRHRVYEFSSAKLPLLQRAGVVILAGTDAGFLNSYVYPGIGLHQELELLVAAGLSPLEALRAATVNGARFLGRGGRAGTVEPGRVADLVILDRDPLRDIRATRDIHAVVLRGAYLDRAALDGLLRDVRRAVQ
jgi:imidazolonepropionase-like amidohydrolase